jgi:ribose transport system substrate-binding protein
VGVAAVLLVSLLLGLGLAACGDDSDDSGGGGASTSTNGESANDVVANAQKELDKFAGPEGSFVAPPAGTPKPPKDKTIVVIPFGAGIPSFAAASKEIAAGARKLGWNARVVDGKFQPNTWLAAIRDAVTAKVDGIITLGPDCPPIKAGLEEAKKANIPVINIEGHDCDTLESGAQPLFAHTVGYSEGELIDWLRQIARLQADWAIVHTKGKAKVLDVYETDAHTFKVMNDEFRKQLKKCPDCEIVDQVTLTAADYGPKLQQKVQQALLQHPDTNVVWPGGTETLLPAGVAAAVRSSQSKPISVGWECDDGSKENFSNGVLGMCINYVPQWEGYAALDALIRIMGGQEPNTKTGHGLRLVTKDINADYVPYQSPVDFRDAYEKAWGVSGG